MTGGDLSRPRASGRAASALLLPASWLYGVGVVAWRAWRLRPGAATRLPIPVVSVGNLTTGGTGKGPVTRWIAERLIERGLHPVIALRGYRAGPEGSDEALEHQRLLPGVEVATGADRRRAIESVRRRDPRINVAILDDGFQHWRIARDLDLVLVDATRPGLEEGMLPAGRRREPRSALRRADAVIVTRAERVDPRLESRIVRWHGRAPIAWCRHAWRSLRVFDPCTRGETAERPVEWLAGKRVEVLAGIAHPEALLGQVAAVAGAASWLARLPDHAHYDAATVRQWIDAAAHRGAGAIVTTMKDWVKIEPLLEAPGRAPPFVVPRLEIDFIAGEAALRARLEAIARID